LNKIDLRDLITFLKNPKPGEHYEISSIAIFLKLVWKTFLALLIIDIIAGVLIVIPLRYFDLFPSLREIKFTSVNILKVTLILPVVEELIFRLPLRISKINFVTSFSLIIFLFLNKGCFSNIFLRLSISLVLFLILYIGIRKEFNFLKFLSGFFTNHFWSIFYFQSLVFGFLHLTNYMLDFRYFFLFPFIAISYISKGCLFGYLRVRFTYGLYLCITSHILINSIYFLVLLR
jgi:hypothetical protein